MNKTPIKTVNITLPVELVSMVEEWRFAQPEYLQPKEGWEYLIWRGLAAVRQ